MFALGIYTGLRLGDCALMDWGSIDLARNRIMTIPRKTARHADGKPVVIPLHPVLAAIIAEVPPESRTGYLLPVTAKTYARDKALVSAVSALPSIRLDGAQGAENVLPAPPAATGTSAPTDGADAAEGRFSAFREAWDALATDEERDRARAYIERRQN